MRIGQGQFAAVAGAALLCLTIPAFSQGTPVTLSLTSVSGDPVITVGGEEVYAGVYGGTSSLSGANPGVICDDFNDDVSVPETWTATAYQVSTLGTATPITDVLFGGSSTTVSEGYVNIGIAGYAELAYLVNLELTSSNKTTQGNLSEAIWSITDPGLSGVDAAAQTFVAQAEAYASSTGDSLSQYSNLWVYSPSPLGAKGEPQEMWGSVSEGGAAMLYLLLAAASCFGAMFFASRSRSGNRTTV